MEWTGFVKHGVDLKNIAGTRASKYQKNNNDKKKKNKRERKEKTETNNYLTIYLSYQFLPFPISPFIS